MKRLMIGGFALLALAGVTDMAAAATPQAGSVSAVTRTRARVIRWVDGDTVRTTRGTVRLIGVDAPERGQECARRATRHARRLAPKGRRIRLVKVIGRDNRDRYGRLLRYVVTPRGVDVGFRQIRRGLAAARYDSGSYGTHPRRARYRRADARHPDQDCTPTPPPPPPDPRPGPGCHPAYPDFCIPPPPPDLDCADIGTSFTVNHAYGDPHNFDADGDGHGCDSYG